MEKSTPTPIKIEKIPNRPIVDRFPFPFKGDSHDFSNNSTPLDPPFVLDITPEYIEEIKLKRKLLDSRKEQTYQSYPHSIEAQWEILEMIMDEMASIHPNYFSVIKDGNQWTFQNDILEEEYSFTFGDSSSLPYEPLDFIGRHVQADLIYLAQKDGDLFLDAGQLCFPANWSLAFDLGMDFLSIHFPVPSRFTNTGLAEKIRGFILRMEAGKPWTRFNWTMTVEPILGTSPETYDDWGPKKDDVTSENAGKLVYFRVEDQRLFRLPRSNGILFSIHTHIIPLEELTNNRKWTDQLRNVLVDLADDIAEYKGLLFYKDKLVTYLEKRLEETFSN
ncbi:heme-dependent oxidative N-demethylase family protein [Peribacillus loiseleuriae]|uniref:heme-dependent oxidative N-demethylase family protein n=1 Tax=Peribacillus loiseleuriae TaxID=1679170 RepID=UPI0038284A3B